MGDTALSGVELRVLQLFLLQLCLALQVCADRHSQPAKLAGYGIYAANRTSHTAALCD
jgi:hypothetical protein